MYGLGDAGLKWYNRLVSVLHSLNGKKAEMETAVLVFHSRDGTLEGLVSIYVEDFFYCGVQSFE